MNVQTLPSDNAIYAETARLPGGSAFSMLSHLWLCSTQVILHGEVIKGFSVYYTTLLRHLNWFTYPPHCDIEVRNAIWRGEPIGPCELFPILCKSKHKQRVQQYPYQCLRPDFRQCEIMKDLQSAPMPGLRLSLFRIATAYRLMSVPLYKSQFPSAEGILKARLNHVTIIWLKSSADGQL